MTHNDRHMLLTSFIWSTNGKLWIKNIADNIGATLMGCCTFSPLHLQLHTEATRQMSSAATNLSLWPSNLKPVEFIGESGVCELTDWCIWLIFLGDRHLRPLHAHNGWWCICSADLRRFNQCASWFSSFECHFRGFFQDLGWDTQLKSGVLGVLVDEYEELCYQGWD